MCEDFSENWLEDELLNENKLQPSTSGNEPTGLNVVQNYKMRNDFIFWIQNFNLLSCCCFKAKNLLVIIALSKKKEEE